MSIPRAALLASLVLVAAACARRERVTEDGGGAALMLAALQAPAIDVIVPAGPTEERCALLAALDARASSDDDALPREPRLFVYTSPEESRADHARVVVGAGRDSLAGLFARGAGVAFPSPGTFTYLGQVFDRPDDAWIATFQDPQRDGLPITVFLGNDLARLAIDLDAPLWGWKPNVRVLRAGLETLSAPLDVDGACQLERVVRHAPLRSELRKRYAQLPANGASFWGLASNDVERARLDPYYLAAASAAARCAAWASPGRDAEPCALVLHAWPEDLARWTGSRELAWYDAHEGSVHALLARGVPDDAGAAVALRTASARLGPCRDPWLEQGVAVLASEHWYGRDLASWAGWIERAGAVESVETLVDARSDARVSPHVLAPLRAELVRVVLELRGAEHVRQLWRGTQRLAIDDALRTAFRARIGACAGSSTASAIDPRDRRRALGVAGLVVSEPAFGAEERGFGTRACAESLEKATELGARAFAFTSTLAADLDAPPIAGRGGAGRGGAGRGGARAWGSREGDVGLACAVAQARARGAESVAFLPELLSGPAGSWSGTWLRNGETAWRAYFDDYRRFALHYALLAELCGADVLSLGGGSLETTRKTVEGRRGDPREVEWKAAGWSSVVRAARGAYRGRLTFLAGSGEEVEKLGFWDELDLVGLEPRVVLRMQRGMQQRDALARFLQVLAGTWASGERAAREHERPLFVASASFPIAPAAEDARIGPGSDGEELRAESFERLTQLAIASRERLHGAFIGRWSTSLDDRGLGPRDHLLAGEHGAELAKRVMAALARR